MTPAVERAVQPLPPKGLECRHERGTNVIPEHGPPERLPVRLRGRHERGHGRRGRPVGKVEKGLGPDREEVAGRDCLGDAGQSTQDRRWIVRVNVSMVPFSPGAVGPDRRGRTSPGGRRRRPG